MVPGEALQDHQQTDVAGNGASEPPMSLRELCARAANQIGRPAVSEIFKKHGVEKLSEVKDEAAFRADVEAASNRPTIVDKMMGV